LLPSGAGLEPLRIVEAVASETDHNGFKGGNCEAHCTVDDRRNDRLALVALSAFVAITRATPRPA